MARKREALGLLSLRVANYFNIVGDEVFGCKPRFNIVLGHPGREISEENGKAHS